jgi:hypothetical protein
MRFSPRCADSRNVVIFLIGPVVIELQASTLFFRPNFNYIYVDLYISLQPIIIMGSIKMCANLFPFKEIQCKTKTNSLQMPGCPVIIFTFRMCTYNIFQKDPKFKSLVNN